MSRRRYVDWVRLALCGFVAGVIWNVLSSAAVAVFAPNFLATVQRGAPLAPRGGAYFYAIDIAMGVWGMWLYSVIAPRYGARLTAVGVAGLAWWLMKSLQSAKWAGLGLVPMDAALIPLVLASLVIASVALLAGAWLYDHATRQPATA